MADGAGGDTWVALIGSGGVGAVVGALGTIIVAVINQRSPMAALIDARIKTLIEGYEKRIFDLTKHIERLETKVEKLTNELAEREE